MVRLLPPLYAWLALCCSVLFVATAHAGASDAQQLFKRAEEAFTAEDFEQAAQLFEEANQHAPHPSVMFNAAVSWDHAGEFARAADAYRAALEVEGLNPEQTEESERRLTALGKRLGYVQVAKPIDGLISVAHVEREPIPARFYLPPGDYEVVLETADGERNTTVISVEAGQTTRLSLGTTATPPRPPQPEPLPEPEPTPIRDEPARTQEIAGWVGVGIGVVAAGVAVYLGTEALTARDRFVANRTDADMRDEAVTRQTQTNVAWGGATVAGGVGLVLLLTAPTVEF